MIYYEKNRTSEVKEMLERITDIETESDKQIAELKAAEERLYTKEVQAYLKCEEEIDSIETSTEQKIRNAERKCKHNLFFVKEVHSGPFLENRVILECVCCHTQISNNGADWINKWYKEHKIVCGYDESEMSPFIPVKDYLGEDAKKIIRDYYLQICSQVLTLENGFANNGYDDSIASIMSPEEVTVKYFETLFKEKDKNQSGKQLTRRLPIYINERR